MNLSELTVQSISEPAEFVYAMPTAMKHDPLLLYAQRAGFSRCSAEFEISRDNHYPFLTIHLIFSGCGFFQICRKEYFLTQGDAFLILPGEAHSYCNVNTSPLALAWAELGGTFCQEAAQRLRQHGVYALPFSDSAAEALLALLHHLQEKGCDDLYRSSSLIYVFLMELLRLADGIVAPGKPPLFLAAQDYIQAHLSSRLQAQDVADALHISSTYLNRLFRRCAGDSTHHYIIRKKIEYACILLSSTDDTCEQISERIGISDAAYFYRVFRMTTGVTPGEYRRMLRCRL